MNQSKVSALISQLASDDPTTRQKARQALVDLGGHDVTQALMEELVDPRQQVRWEAAKALVAIADPIAAHGLLHSMEDEDEDIRWVAAEGLIALRQIGLLTTLSGLTRQARSIEFCKSAHHVLFELKKKGHAESIDPVLQALDASEPQVGAPVAAYNALIALKQER